MRCGHPKRRKERRNEMTMREEMRSLGNEIVRSYEARIGGIAQMQETVSTDLAATRTQLKALNGSRGTMSKKLKSELAKSAADLKRDVGTMLKGFDAELKKVRTDIAGGHDEWQKLGATMHAKRKGPKAKEAAPPPQGEE